MLIKFGSHPVGFIDEAYVAYDTIAVNKVCQPMLSDHILPREETDEIIACLVM